MSSPYRSLLEALRVHCNLPEFPNPLPSEQLVLELKNGSSISIDFNEESSMVVLFAEIATYSPEDELAVLSKIAEANFLWAATSGSTLSARPEIQTIYLAQQFAVNLLEGAAFIKLVEEFVQVVQQWKTIVEKTFSSNSSSSEQEETKNIVQDAEIINPSELS